MISQNIPKIDPKYQNPPSFLPKITKKGDPAAKFNENFTKLKLINRIIVERRKWKWISCKCGDEVRRSENIVKELPIDVDRK